MASCFSLASCENWFDIKPKRLTEEADLFSKEDGFKEALTGAYIKAAKTDLYGTTLSYGFIDGLAQRYTSMSQTPESYIFTPESDTPNSIWSSMYNLIANLNNMLHWAEKNKHVFVTPGYYEIIKGEALGLRAYLYLDMLRMFGPVYKLNSSAKSVPYRTELNRDKKELENADVLLKSIIDALLEAEKLLDGRDPLDFVHTKAEAQPGDDPFLIHRFKRMNLLAVKALLARAYLYQGNKTLAAQYAEEVVDSGKFKLIPTMKVTGQHPVTELIFGLHFNNSANRNNLQDISSYYTINRDTFLNELFNLREDGPNDIRLKEGSGFFYDGNYHRPLKYDQINVSPSMRATIPLIRLPEMYYILAECTSSLRDATDYINMVRSMRGVDDLPGLDSENERMKHIELEYRKEFYAEGQLWYFYKRHFYRTFLHCPVLDDLTEANYTFSIPENEYTFGGITDN